MSGYVRSTKFETEFDGAKVTAYMRPLNVTDFLSLEQLMPKVGEDRAALEGRGARVIETYQRLLPKYVKDLTGVKTADGEPVTIEEVCEASYFIQLMMRIGVALVGAAKIGDPTSPPEPLVASSAAGTTSKATPEPLAASISASG